MSEDWFVAIVVFVLALCSQWVLLSLTAGRGLPYRLLLKRAEKDPYFNREYARPSRAERLAQKARERAQAAHKRKVVKGSPYGQCTATTNGGRPCVRKAAFSTGLCETHAASRWHRYTKRDPPKAAP